MNNFVTMYTYHAHNIAPLTCNFPNSGQGMTESLFIARTLGFNAKSSSCCLPTCPSRPAAVKRTTAKSRFSPIIGIGGVNYENAREWLMYPHFYGDDQEPLQFRMKTTAGISLTMSSTHCKISCRWVYHLIPQSFTVETAKYTCMHRCMDARYRSTYFIVRRQ